MDTHARHQKFMDLARKFSAGKIEVKQFAAGPETGFEPRYFPKIAGHHVRPKGMPDDGYLTQVEAEQGAWQYQADCRAAVSHPPASH